MERYSNKLGSVSYTHLSNKYKFTSYYIFDTVKRKEIDFMIKKGLIRLIIFIHEVYIRMRNNELIDMANALSFKLILSIFPFIIFILSSVAVFNLDVSNIVVSLTDDVPETVRQMLRFFIKDVYKRQYSKQD